MLGPLRIMEWAEVSWSKGWQKHHRSKLRPWEPHTSLFFFALEFDSFYTLLNVQVSQASDSKCKIGSFLELEI